jgi:Arc/MetJ-type ribon-helix-helix transcriptional regulator
MGRNRVKPDLKMDRRIQIMVTSDEAKRLEAAKDAGKYPTMSEFGRDALFAHADRIEKAEGRKK